MDVTDYSLQSQVRAFEERQGLKVGDKVHFMDVKELEADGWHLDENKNAWTKENIHHCKVPYGVVVNYNGLARPLFNISPTQHFQITLDNALDGEHNGLVYVSLNVDGEKPKPYLRPMSSMTEEELEELNTLTYHNISVQDNALCGYICSGELVDVFDWLNSHHFDYRGLIEKNLALDCTGLHIYD